jgi:hypothetical protein
MRYYQETKLASLAAQKGAALRADNWSDACAFDRAFRLHRAMFRIDAWIRARPIVAGMITAALPATIFGVWAVAFGAYMGW